MTKDGELTREVVLEAIVGGDDRGEAVAMTHQSQLAPSAVTPPLGPSCTLCATPMVRTFQCPACGSISGLAPSGQAVPTSDSIEWWKETAYRLENTIRLLRTELGQIGAAAPSGERTAEELVVEIARELYDRFVMGGWQPQDAYPQIRRWLSEPIQKGTKMDFYALQRAAVAQFVAAMAIVGVLSIGAWELGKYLLHHLVLIWR